MCTCGGITVFFAVSVASGGTALDTEPDSAASREIKALAQEVLGLIKP